MFDNKDLELSGIIYNLILLQYEALTPKYKS